MLTSFFGTAERPRLTASTPPALRLPGPANGQGATAEAVLRGPTGNSQVENLFWGRQTLYGKELLIEIAAEEE